jgi:hypothetical protein
MQQAALIQIAVDPLQTGGDIEQQPSALYAGGGLVQQTRADLHGEY